MNQIGKKIKLLRQQNGWSQEDAATRLQISIPAFSKIETGITDVSYSRLEEIAGIFNLSTTQLLTLNGGEQKKSAEQEIAALNKKLLEREMEVIDLQKKIIELFEELRKIEKKRDGLS